MPQGHDLGSQAEHDRNKGIGTYATRTRDGQLTVAYNTDSDDGTDIEDSALGKRSAKDRAEDAGKAPRVKRR